MSEIEAQGPSPSGSVQKSPSPEPHLDFDKASMSSPTPDTPDMEETPPPVVTGAKLAKKGPILIGDLPRAEIPAKNTFIEIEANIYQYQKLGRSREALEGMTCECVWQGEDSAACGEHSDCINRLTQVECLLDDCRCGDHCQNQRFRLRQYGDIHVVQTEKKGFGLRAGQTLPKDTFIYEYVGDVVSQPSFMKRMRDYAAEGIKHFYFMMLQKEEYIDATKRGGIGRFANHSCNPNCYVAKWTVGHHVRMGIFASRTIKQDEELTFNYNVDRYGHEAQPCYCGEDKCVGFIGGKTQTDIGGMDELFIDALGISDEVEKLGLKGTKKKKGKKLDEDFTPTLKPLSEKDIPKLIQAVRQTQNRKVLFKLLTRIKMTQDQTALRQLMRLRGFSLMNNILDDNETDMELIALALECMMEWPLLTRAKIDDSKINVPVEALCTSENEVIKVLAQKLVDHWSTLSTYVRIPKRAHDAPRTVDRWSPPPGFVIPAIFTDPITIPNHERSPKRQRIEHVPVDSINIKPLGMNMARVPKRAVMKVETVQDTGPSKQAIQAVILAASKAAEEAAAAAAAVEEEEKKKKERKQSSSNLTPEEKEKNKEKRLLKLVGAIVVKVMSKYKSSLDHEKFKKHAEQLTKLIADKEKKSSSYKDAKLDALSDEKVAKIKKFAKDYMLKLLHGSKRQQQQQSRPEHTGWGDDVATGSGCAPIPTTTSTKSPAEWDNDDPRAESSNQSITHLTTSSNTPNSNSNERLTRRGEDPRRKTSSYDNTPRSRSRSPKRRGDISPSPPPRRDYERRDSDKRDRDRDLGKMDRDRDRPRARTPPLPSSKPLPTGPRALGDWFSDAEPASRSNSGSGSGARDGNGWQNLRAP